PSGLRPPRHHSQPHPVSYSKLSIIPLDLELYRRTLYLPVSGSSQKLRRISVIDIQPEHATGTVVLVHGYGGSALQWLYQIRFFSQTMRVIAPDVRGHGLTDDPTSLPYTINCLLENLETVPQSLHAQHSFSLIAHSFGGAIATE